VKTLLVVAAGLALWSAPIPAREMVAVRVTPVVSVAPATVRLVVTVEPDTNNRELEIEADSGLFYTSSTVQLDGSNAPRLQSFVFKELPAGTYEVQVRVAQRNGNKRQARAECTVLD
jgi:hypothetical protein